MTEKGSAKGSPIGPLAVVAVAVVGMALVGTGTVDLHFLAGGWFAHHWLAWAGALFIAIYTAAFYVLKSRKREGYDTLLHVHVYGSLLSAALVALHFTQHVTRPAEFYPDLGTGLVLFSALIVSVITGFLIRFRWLRDGVREWRLFHTGAAGAFYLAVVVHVLQGLRVL